MIFENSLNWFSKKFKPYPEDPTKGVPIKYDRMPKLLGLTYDEEVTFRPQRCCAQRSVSGAGQTTSLTGGGGARSRSDFGGPGGGVVYQPISGGLSKAFYLGTP